MIQTALLLNYPNYPINPVILIWHLGPLSRMRLVDGLPVALRSVQGDLCSLEVRRRPIGIGQCDRHGAMMAGDFSDWRGQGACAGP